MDRPFCEHTRSVLIAAAKELGLTCHEHGTTVTIEGPRFSSKAESMMFRGWGCDVVNMTTVPEVCLAKEAGICYASIGLPTDYDSWKDEPVSGWVREIETEGGRKRETEGEKERERERDGQHMERRWWWE